MPDDVSYQVVWSRKAINTLKSLRTQGHLASMLQELPRVLQGIDERLRLDPLSFGEVYRSQGVIKEHLAVQEFLAVDFAVDDQRKYVLVRHCRVLSGA
jgi:hypothetical protein